MIWRALLTFVMFANMTAFGAELTVGSKAFTEGLILGEWLAQTLEAAHRPINRRPGIGVTGLLFSALRTKSVDFYVEYSGTLADAILKRPSLDLKHVRAELDRMGLVMSEPLGFSNNYAIAVTAEFAEKYRVRTLRDLARVASKARGGFSYEFVERADGLKKFLEVCRCSFVRNATAMDHALAYEALGQDRLDVTDVFTTDAKIEKFGLHVLEDDLKFFPRYEAVVLTRKDVVQRYPRLWAQLRRATGSLDEVTVRQLNAQVDLERRDYKQVVREYLNAGDAPASSPWSDQLRDLTQRTHEHLFLVGIALLFSIVVGIPLGVIARVRPWLGQTILLLSGTLQTIPALALLCFLIPVAGIGTGSALVALCLYGLLPVVSGTYVGLTSLDPGLLEMTRALRLTWWQRLTRVEFPLASRALLTGVRTSAVISIGTATLAALVGAGGYGATIMSGLAINDMNAILAGALPAAVMALVVHGLFELVGRWLIPRGLRI